MHSPAAAAEDSLHELQEHSVDFQWPKLVNLPVVAGGYHLTYPVYSDYYVTQKCRLQVYVQGDLQRLEGKTIFLTVHDIGKSHMSFVNFVNSQPMAALKERAVFLHVCVPGQSPDAMDVEGDFPPVDKLGDALAQVMEKFNLRSCVALGEGAGADIVCRFAMKYHHLVLGVALIHCTSTTHGILEQVREIFLNLRLDDGIMGKPAWNYLLTHRYGNHNMDAQQKQYIDRVRTVERLNEKNLSRYIYSFAHRDDFTHELGDSMGKVEAVLVTGGKSAHNGNVQHMFERMNKSKTAMLVAEDCLDVLEEAPEYVACALLLLCQRKGLLPDVELPALKQANYTNSVGSLTCANSHAQQESEAPMSTFMFHV